MPWRTLFGEIRRGHRLLQEQGDAQFLLAMNSRMPRRIRLPASSLTIIAGKPRSYREGVTPGVRV
ncbi:hypothetical protein C4K18_4585 [Pseudomonas chlororaphis subsp. aurantiaca]|nr:hypothetical protein C4K18_4585 [Pseudomonas chlororaphis subsp. aurantiaca]